MKKILTPKLTEESLCVTCYRSVITEGRTYKDTIVTCNAHDRTIMFPVTECSGYSHKNAPSLYDMKEIAWPIMVDKKGNMIGFRAPKEAEKLEKDGKAEVGGTRIDGDW